MELCYLSKNITYFVQVIFRRFLSCERVFVGFKWVVVCCLSCGEGVGVVGVFRFGGGGGLVYEVWSGGGDDDCW